MLNILTALLTAFDGPYKWYAVTAVLVLLGLTLTRTVFKTIKWILIFILIIMVIFIIASYSDIIQY